MTDPAEDTPDTPDTATHHADVVFSTPEPITTPVMDIAHRPTNPALAVQLDQAVRRSME